MIKPFKNEIAHIAKIEGLNRCYIRITMLDGSAMTFPYIPLGSTMYEGMEVDEEYTLEKLGLWL